MRNSLVVGLAGFALGAAAMAGVGRPASAATPTSETLHMFEVFGSVFDLVGHHYVEPVEDKALIQSAMGGMVGRLDPHSSYLTPEEFADLRSGGGGGASVGVEVGIQGDNLVVVAATPGGPAERAGVMPGDRIEAIDGRPVHGASIADVVRALRGPTGSSVALALGRAGAPPVSITTVRGPVQAAPVVGRMIGDVGYIRLSAFNGHTSEEAAQAIRTLAAANPHMRGLVIDLRNNPGGLLQGATAFAGLFLNGGEVAHTIARTPADSERYAARKDGDVLAGKPIVVMINGGTGAAAELVAAALQDRSRAKVVGLRSFGDGSIQTVMPLSGGRDGAVKMTTARFVGPRGRPIDILGVEPDVAVANTADQARAAIAGSAFSEASLFHNAAVAARRPPDPQVEAPPVGFDPKGDYQLSRALAVVGGT